MQNKIHTNGKAIFIMKCLLCSYLVTGVLLLVLALLLYRLHLSENVVSIGITIIYIVSAFLAGFISGKKIGKQKFLWGLFMGCIYFLVLLLISLLVNHGVEEVAMKIGTTFFLCAGSGMLGGMLS